MVIKLRNVDRDVSLILKRSIQHEITKGILCGLGCAQTVISVCRDRNKVLNGFFLTVLLKSSIVTYKDMMISLRDYREIPIS